MTRIERSLDVLIHLHLIIFNHLSHREFWKGPLYSQRGVIQKLGQLLLLLKLSNVISNSVDPDQTPC